MTRRGLGTPTEIELMQKQANSTGTRAGTGTGGDKTTRELEREGRKERLSKLELSLLI